MKYRHVFRVQASLRQVADFHHRADSMVAITPPPVAVRLLHTPDILKEGDEMAFILWIGFLPVHWRARIESVAATGFTDRQLKGPFKEWIHRHNFMPIDEQTTEVVDEITLELSQHPFWWLFGIGMRIGLPVLFAYRSWKTRRMLQ